MISKIKELRSNVRTDFSYSVRYEIISPEEYSLIKKSGLHKNSDRKKFKIPPVLSDNKSKKDFDLKNCGHDDALVDFLIKIDKKLDIILSMLPINEVRSKTVNPELSNQGFGNNISAAGISIFTYEPASKGHIINMKINLSEFSPVSIDTYGEIIRVTDIYKNKTQMYDLGVQFIDLAEKDREKIVAFVFSKQRESIRNWKTKTEQYKIDP